MTTSCLYSGDLTHRRLRPQTHDLRYRLFQIYLDLDEAEALARKTRLFGFNRPGLISFHERDHGADARLPLKQQIEALLRERGHATGGAVRVLCLPRVLGFVFNPISIYFCDDARGRLSALVYEVNNTFGDRVFYVLPAAAEGRTAHRTAKAMHVSPFMDMDHDYDFSVDAPGERFRIAIQVKRAGEVWLTAAFAGRRSPLEDKTILAAWLADPLMTLKVVAAIHWEALRLWCKGVRYRPKPHGRIRGGLCPHAARQQPAAEQHQS